MSIMLRIVEVLRAAPVHAPRRPHGCTAALLAGAIAAMLLPSGSANAAEAAAGKDANQCVACHEVEELPITLGHSMPEWRGSAHGRAGVACEKCHGGDPKARDAAAAHKGVLPASDPASLISSQKVSAMCGSCHKDQLAAYKSTVHADEIVHDTVAATCVTCHGAMATSLPSPNELKTRCTVCHERPIEPRAALSWLAAAKTELKRTRRLLEDAQKQVPDWHKDAIQRFHDMEKAYAKIVLKWHTFDTEGSLHEARDLLNLGKLLDEEARLKMKMAKESGKKD